VDAGRARQRVAGVHRGDEVTALSIKLAIAGHPRLPEMPRLFIRRVSPRCTQSVASHDNRCQKTPENNYAHT
jgi:hypothetical protein